MASSMALAMASGQDNTSISLFEFLRVTVERQRIPFNCSIKTVGATPLLKAAETTLHVASDCAGHPPALPRLAKTSHRPLSSSFTLTKRVPQPIRNFMVWPFVLRGLDLGTIFSESGGHHEPGGSNNSEEIWVFPLSPDASSAGEPEKIALPRSSWRNMLAGWTPDDELGVFIQSEQQCAIYTVPASGGRAVQITLTSGWPNYPRWSPDGERIYFRGWTGALDKEEYKVTDKYVVTIPYVPSEGGDPGKVSVQSERRLVSRVPNGGHNVSPDGKRIVISTSNGIWTIPLDGGLLTRLTSGESFEGLYPCWSPNGRTIAFTEWNSKYEDEVFYTIYVIPSDGGEISQITSKADRVGGGAIAFSPDGERIAFFSGGAIKTIPIEGGQRQVLVTDVKSGQYNIFRQLAYSPDGSKIAHNAGAKIWITSLGGGEPEELRTGLPENAKLIDFGWSPDGEKIAFIALIGGEEEFWLIENFLPESKTGE
jgi:Tol biopolymer transport system component